MEKMVFVCIFFRDEWEFLSKSKPKYLKFERHGFSTIFICGLMMFFPLLVGVSLVATC